MMLFALSTIIDFELLLAQTRDIFATYGFISLMAFFTSTVEMLGTLVIAIGAGLGIWGVINLLEGYGNDNPGANPPGLFFML